MVSIFPSLKGRITLKELPYFPQALIGLQNAKDSIYLPIIQTYLRICELHYALGISIPPKTGNILADMFYDINGTWNTISNYSQITHESTTGTIYINQLITTDEPINTKTINFPSTSTTYTHATYIPWKNVAIEARYRTGPGTSTGYTAIYCDYAVYDLNNNTLTEKSVWLTQTSNYSGGYLLKIYPIGPSHFAVGIYYTTYTGGTTYYSWYIYFVNFETNSISGSLVMRSDERAVIGTSDGSIATIVCVDPRYNEVYAYTLTNGASPAGTFVGREFDVTGMKRGLVFNGTKFAYWHSFVSYSSSSPHINIWIITEDGQKFGVYTSASTTYYGPCIEDEDTICWYYLYSNNYYKNYLKLSTYQFTSGINLGTTRPEASYFDGGSGLIFRINNPILLTIAGGRAYSPNFWRFTGFSADTSKLIYDYATSYRIPTYIFGGIIYDLSLIHISEPTRPY